MEVLCRVFAGRGVAAADMAARLALPELDPARAFVQALLTGPRRSRRWEVGHGQVLPVFTRFRHGLLQMLAVNESLALISTEGGIANKSGCHKSVYSLESCGFVNQACFVVQELSRRVPRDQL